MAPEELDTWLTNILGPLEVAEISGFTVANGSVMPATVSIGFSDIDTGLLMERPAYKAPGTPDTSVRCELICAAGKVSPDHRAMAIAGAWNTLVNLGVPARPGVLLEGLVDDPQLTVHHGLLREPQLFDRGTPVFNEPGRMTLLLELVLLTDDEYEIASEQGFEVLERRLRRRQTDLGDWGRD